MFDPQPTQTPTPGTPFTPPPSPFVPDPLPGAAGGVPIDPNIRSMPQRFMPGEPGGKHGPKGWVVAVVVAAAVLVVGAAAYLLLAKKILNSNANVKVNGNVNANRNVNSNANANANANANTNANANANFNANANANTNANANANFNANANANTNSNANANANVNGSATTGSPLPSTKDTDGDGLTDVEEQLYGTDLNKVDTDGDGFVDGMKVQPDGSVLGEVALGYDPTTKGRTLEASGLVRLYSASGYALDYPSLWAAQSDTGGGATFVPNLGSGEFVTISIADNPQNLTAKEWYRSLNPGVDLTNEQSFTVSGLDAFQSLDDSTVFYSRSGKVYSVYYNTDGRSDVNYRTTFYFMTRSFRLTGTTNTNG